MPLDQNPHQTVTRFECVGYLMSACEFFVSQKRQFCLFTTYPPRSKWVSSEKMIFSLPKSASSVSRSQAHLAKRIQAHTQPYSFGGRIKLIICQIRHELSVTIYEINTSWKKTLDGGHYISRIFLLLLVQNRISYCWQLSGYAWYCLRSEIERRSPLLFTYLMGHYYNPSVRTTT